MSDPSGLCPGCFLETRPSGSAEPCPTCGDDGGPGEFHSVLKPGTILHDKYEVGRVLGQPGGFGVTYLAYDLRLQRRVALKELMPRELVAREADGTTLHPHSHSDADLFRYTLESFLNEARLVARFSHPNLVKVLDYFEANGTAYFCMDFYEGKTLAEHLRELGRPLTGPEAVALARPLLQALEVVHAEGVLHRDIKPTNIYLRRDGTPVLLDFGAARQALGERSRALTSVLTPGYAPFEQYHAQGNQGAWTDVYGSAATLYFLVTGKAPSEAGARVEGVEELIPPRDLVPDLDPAVNRAIVRGLAVRPEGRPATAAAFLAELEGAEPDLGPATAVFAPDDDDRTAVHPDADRTAVAPPVAAAAAGAAARGAASDATAVYREAESEGAGTAVAEGGERRRSVTPAWLGAGAATVVLALAIPLTAALFSGDDAEEPAAPESAPSAAASPAAPEPTPRARILEDDAAGGDGAVGDAAGDRAVSGGSTGGRADGEASSDAPSSGTEVAEGGTGTAPSGGRDAAGAAPSAGATPSGSAPAAGTEPAAAPGNGLVVLVFGEGAAARGVETALTGALLRDGDLRAIDAGALQAMRSGDGAVQRALAGDFAALADVAGRRGAEFIVVGDLDASAERTVGSFWGARADLDLKMYRVSTRSLVRSRVFRAGERPLVAGSSQSDALRKAVSEVGTEAARTVRLWLRAELR